MTLRFRFVALVVAAFAVLVPSRALAAFPGTNGPIFFDGVRDGNPRGIYRMNPDGSNVTRITPTTGIRYEDPSASADGKKLAVRGCPAPPSTDDCEIYVMNADGTGTPVQITNDSLDEFEPAISPDATRVAFIKFENTPDGDEQNVWIANANGTGTQTNLTGGTISPIGDPNNGNATAGIGEDSPAFSPNGAKIAFTSANPRMLPPGVDFELDFDTEIWVMNANGTGKQQITEDHDPLTPIPFPPGDNSPNFSPDGTKLAWSRLAGVGNFEVVWRNVAGAGAPQPLVTRPGNQEQPTFSPDGTKIAFQESPQAGLANLFVSDVNFAGGTTTATNLTNHTTGQLGDDPDWAAIPRAQPPGGGGTPQYPTPMAPFANCPASSANLILGNAGNNSLVGTPLGDRIFAGPGNDTVDGVAGDDCIDLGPGTDRGQGGAGVDLILGGLGADRLSGGAGNDQLLGGASGDRVIGGSGDDTMNGQSGSDRLNGERGRDRISGGSSSDVISAGSSNDRAAGGQGNDRVNGNSGNDSIKGNSGRDRLTGGSGRDSLSGGSGNDRISARDGRRDRINCGSGRDSVSADRIDRVARNCERVRRR